MKKGFVPKKGDLLRWHNWSNDRFVVFLKKTEKYGVDVFTGFSEGGIEDDWRYLFGTDGYRKIN